MAAPVSQTALAEAFSQTRLDGIKVHFPYMKYDDQNAVLEKYRQMPHIPEQAVESLFACINHTLTHDRENGGKQKCAALALALQIVEQHPGKSVEQAVNTIKSVVQVYQGPVWSTALDLVERVEKSTTEPRHVAELLKAVRKVAMYNQYPEAMAKANALKPALIKRANGLNVSNAQQAAQAKASEAAAFAAELVGSPPTAEAA